MKRRLVSAALSSAIAIATSAMAREVHQPIQLFDAAGKLMGEQFASPSGVAVMLKIGLSRFVIPLVPQQLEGGGSSPTRLDYAPGYVDYTSSDCSGPAYLPSLPMGASYGVVLVSRSGTITIFPPKGKHPTQISVGSTWNGDSCVVNSGPILVVPAAAPVDATSRFARPFIFR